MLDHHTCYDGVQYRTCRRAYDVVKSRWRADYKHRCDEIRDAAARWDLANWYNAELDDVSYWVQARAMLRAVGTCGPYDQYPIKMGPGRGATGFVPIVRP